MRQSRLLAGLFVTAVSLVAAGAAQAQTKSMEFRNGEILAVDGDIVTVRGQDGVKQFVVPASYKFDLDGKQVTVHDLKPGMKYTAMITTTETPIEVTATEVRQGEVVYNEGGTIVVKNTATGELKQFTPEELRTRNVVVYMDGKEMDPRKLKKGDKLSATVVTKMPPKIITEQELQVQLAAAKPPPPPPASRTAAMTPPPQEAPPSELPKTGSLLPLLGLAGMALLGLGAGVSALRLFATRN